MRHNDSDDLSSLEAPRHTRVLGRLVSHGDVVSPMTGFAAALLQWRFSTGRSYRNDRRGTTRSSFTSLVSGLIAGHVEVETSSAVVELRLDGLTVQFERDPEDMTPVYAALPAEFEWVHGRHDPTAGPLYYGEWSIENGATVVVEGYVARTGVRADGFTTACTRPDLGPVTLREVIR